MIQTVQLAGFLAAQAMLEVARGKNLGPLIIFEKGAGTSHFVHFQEKDPEKAASQAEKILKANAEGAMRGVLAFDAYLNLPQGRSDAIFLHARRFVPRVQHILMAVPYRHVKKPGGFTVHCPKWFAFEGEGLPEAELINAFYIGVNKHETGGKFWQDHFEDSY